MQLEWIKTQLVTYQVIDVCTEKSDVKSTVTKEVTAAEVDVKNHFHPKLQIRLNIVRKINVRIEKG